MSLSDFAGIFNFFRSCVFFTPAEIFFDCAAEKEVDLKHHCNAVTQGGDIVVLYVHTAHLDGTAGGVVKSRDQLHKAGLGGTGAAQNTDGLAGPKGQAADLFDYVSHLFQWRKTKDVIHNGKTMHFITRDNTYGYFRYDDDEVVFVYVNNSLEPKNVPWTYYSEISEGLTGGVDVVTGQPCEVSDSTVVAPQSVLIVEYQK